MPWVRSGKGLKYIGEPHYDADVLRGLIRQLRGARNRPQKVCAQLDELLVNGVASKDLIWRLSKWCDWDDWSAGTSRRIASELFYGNICRRLRDQKNHPIDHPAPAEVDYQAWLDRVVAAGARASANDAMVLRPEAPD